MTFIEFYNKVTEIANVYPSIEYVRILWSYGYDIDQAVNNLKTMHEE